VFGSISSLPLTVQLGSIVKLLSQQSQYCRTVSIYLLMYPERATQTFSMLDIAPICTAGSRLRVVSTRRPILLGGLFYCQQFLIAPGLPHGFATSSRISTFADSPPFNSSIWPFSSSFFNISRRACIRSCIVCPFSFARATRGQHIQS
jgi:hypothetical protein